jgi:hypothetical protein
MNEKEQARRFLEIGLAAAIINILIQIFLSLFVSG